MSDLPMPRGSATPQTSRGSAPVERAPGRLRYVPADRIGFEKVPDALVWELQAAKVLTGRIWLGFASDVVVKRRQDGSHYQQVLAFWASQWRYVELDGRRELRMGSDGRLRPAGPWTATGTVRDFPTALAPQRSVWRDQPSGAGARRRAQRVCDDPLEVLPRAVTGPVVGGRSQAWQILEPQSASETIVAANVTADRVLLLRARRQARSEHALELADWAIETAEVQGTQAEPFSVDPRQRTLGQGPRARLPSTGCEGQSPARPGWWPKR